MVFLLEDEGDHLRARVAKHQQLEQQASAGQVVFGAALQHAVMPEAVLLGDHAHALEVRLADVRRQVAQRLQGLFAGIDHVAEVEQGMQARVVEAGQQLRDLGALELFMLLEVEVQVVLVGLLREVVQVRLDHVHDPRQRPFVA
ncbi:hypothetical protein D3C76_1467930 [compost metagenome]